MRRTRGTLRRKQPERADLPTNKKTILHELAHAWAHGNLTDRQHSQFTALRGLGAWNDHTLEWSERATEHAAETIGWALMDRNTQVLGVIAVDGIDRQKWRLLTIGDSDPDQLHAACIAFCITHNSPACD